MIKETNKLNVLSQNISDTTNRFLIYKSLLNIYFEELDKNSIPLDILLKLNNFQNELDKMTEYMLHSRFIPSAKKIKPELDEATKIIISDKDLVRYFEIQKKVTLPLYLPDIIKFYKLLENFMLKRRYIELITEYKLGEFTDSCFEIYNNFSILLLNVIELSPEIRKPLLNYIFSLIRIYRQFSIKSIPNAVTIVEPYSGDPLDKIMETYFSDDTIQKFLSEITNDDKIYNQKLSLTLYSGNASSPNAKASASKIEQDIYAVYNEPDLKKSIFSLASHFDEFNKFSVLCDKLYDFAQLKWLHAPHVDAMIHSKLFHFTAPGGKARIIANVD
jgi:hypothetical protein